jgi:hypothetical protein
LARWLDALGIHALDRDRERTIRRSVRAPEKAQYLTRFGALPWLPNRRKIGDVIDAMQGIIHLPEVFDPPCWPDPGTARHTSGFTGRGMPQWVADVSTRSCGP